MLVEAGAPTSDIKRFRGQHFLVGEKLRSRPDSGHRRRMNLQQVPQNSNTSSDPFFVSPDLPAWAFKVCSSYLILIGTVGCIMNGMVLLLYFKKKKVGGK